ncbi:hypothetical protein TRFO_11030 [Tritrichomonas foetus]|uniref:Uncharacterized protein n=1 Tax=Tritrichomonas foetus TaxID=1144522 RepID=A0A1J4J8R7_9EUKA|nr:hypothetical protein TRFO_11030 [Tritrichomonas foetus]|eukprot:OHS94639.1 hypothetical protein TRFO_11030 [Tritrichomonas foetus]
MADSAKSRVMKLMEPDNRDWIRWLRIPALYSHEARHDAVYYLFTLCTSIFIDFKSYQQEDPDEDPQITRTNRLKYIRSIYNFYGIQQPTHWSPILNLSVDEEDNQDQELLMFNEAIKNLRYYLTPDQEFRKELQRDIEARYTRCENLAEELENVAAEDRFYRDKFERIQKFLKDKKDKDKAVVQSIIDALFDPNQANNTRSRSLTTY